LATADQNTPRSKLLARDTAEANLIKATIEAYYASNGKYPSDYEKLVAYVQDDRSGTWSANDKKDFTNIKTHLIDFAYTVRGDGQAYQFTYTDVDGKPVTIKGDYQNDYH